MTAGNGKPYCSAVISGESENLFTKRRSHTAFSSMGSANDRGRRAVSQKRVKVTGLSCHP